MKNFLYLFCVSFLLISCGSDDNAADDDDNGLPDNNETYVTALINGERYLSNNELLPARAIVETITNDPFNDDLIFLDINSYNATSLIFTELEIITNAINFEDVVAGFELTNVGNFTTTISCNYLRSGAGNSISAYTQDSSVGDILKITFIDREERIISGEFSFTVFDYGTNETYLITEGVFNRIPYSIL